MGLKMRFLLVLFCLVVLPACSDSASRPVESYSQPINSTSSDSTRNQYFRVPENERLIGAIDIEVESEDNGSIFISGGTDADQFSISRQGDLYFVELPDFEMPSDADYQNNYELLVEIITGSNRTNVEIIIEVYDVNEDQIPSRELEKWPNYIPHESLNSEISRLKGDYLSKNIDPSWREAERYDPKGHYLGYGVYGDCQSKPDSDTVKLREDGVLMLKKDGSWYTSPVASAQCGLHHYLYNGRQVDRLTMAYIEDLLASQDETGAFRYPYEITYRDQSLGTHWISGMAQGQAVSFFSRVLQDHHMPRLEDAALKAIDLLILGVEEGGTMSSLTSIDESLSAYVAFEEVITEPQSLILNGFMFSLLGLYDWSHVQTAHNNASQVQAGLYFERGIATLREILPYYDVGGWTTYDLAHITIPNAQEKLATPEYHAAHIYLLEALYAITNDYKLGHILRAWSDYVDYVH